MSARVNSTLAALRTNFVTIIITAPSSSSSFRNLFSFRITYSDVYSIKYTQINEHRQPSHSLPLQKPRDRECPQLIDDGWLLDGCVAWPGLIIAIEFVD